MTVEETFREWIRNECSRAREILLRDLDLSPRYCFFESNDPEYAHQFYVRLERWSTWQSSLIAGLRRRARNCDQLIHDAQQRFATTKLTRFTLYSTSDIHQSANIDLSNRSHYAAHSGWMALREWFAHGREEPPWNTILSVMTMEIEAFERNVLNQIKDLDLQDLHTSRDTEPQQISIHIGGSVKNSPILAGKGIQVITLENKTDSSKTISELQMYLPMLEEQLIGLAKITQEQRDEFRAELTQITNLIQSKLIHSPPDTLSAEDIKAVAEQAIAEINLEKGLRPRLWDNPLTPNIIASMIWDLIKNLGGSFS